MKSGNKMEEMSLCLRKDEDLKVQHRFKEDDKDGENRATN